ncbi:MAG: hypothetical protein E7656_07045 [Ruminococcaceae bacterium]|nr:hypothetical protein [Oscillospiraceae bacterium]
MKKILALSMAALCTASLLTSCATKKGTTQAMVEENPGLEVSESVAETFTKTIDATPIAVVNKVSDSGNVHMSISAKESGQKVNVDFWVSTGKSINAAARIDAMGINGTAYLNENALVLECDKILGNKAYGIGFKNLADKLEDSVLPELMGIAADELLGEAGDAIEMIENFGDYVKESAEYLAESENDLYEIISDEGNYTAKEEKFSVSDGEVMAVVLDYEIIPELVSTVAKEYLEIMLDSPAVTNYLSTFGAYGELGANMFTSGMLDEYLDETIDQIEYDVYDAFEEMGVDEIPLTIVINKATGAFVYAELENNEGEKITIDLGVNPEKSDKWILSIEDDGEEFEVVLTKKFAKNNVEIALEADGDELFAIEIKGGKLTIEADGEEVLTGDCKYSKNSFELTIEEVGGEPMQPSMTIAVDTKAAPKAPGYKDILTMSMQEFEKLGQTVQTNMMRSMGGMDMMY